MGGKCVIFCVALIFCVATFPARLSRSIASHSQLPRRERERETRPGAAKEPWRHSRLARRRAHIGWTLRGAPSISSAGVAFVAEGFGCGDAVTEATEERKHHPPRLPAPPPSPCRLPRRPCALPRNTSGSPSCPGSSRRRRPGKIRGAVGRRSSTFPHCRTHQVVLLRPTTSLGLGYQSVGFRVLLRLSNTVFP